MTSDERSQLAGLPKRGFILISVGLVLFSLYTAMFGVFPDIIQRGVHLSVVLLLVYVRLYGLADRDAYWHGWTRLKFAALGVLAAMAAENMPPDGAGQETSQQSVPRPCAHTREQR